ncbi:MAG: M20/M25/M40 family metallo-hydrolase [Phenylobacterium sp.]|uniref:M20/M25/M40 family metallo-hydrolase n=1 Tax=Phenylobacterium sp. TaxID=1871053 RepID=UPI0025E3A7FD|nr:M20/M25/M40 family metallo-hydrolase [Phenylobacterium sp.]MBI1200723.1 M20/M25/M40 family metallo-hydrolase [Phenylobacterium sp.]
MIRIAAALAATMLAAGAAQAAAPKADGGEAAFRDLYKQLVETNTTASAGSCTRAAEQIGARLKAAGYPDADIHLLVPPEHPRAGNIVAVLPGKDLKAKAVLLLAHLDVVEAKREDWTRDPFRMIEEDGYFYGRGVSDDKAQAAIFADMMIRFRQEGYKPRRTVKLMLTCGEEGGWFNGAHWLTTTQRDLIDAGIALNEGAGGELDAAGNRVDHSILAAEKSPVTFIFEVTNPGGHSSRPVPDNAIYHLARALDAVSRYEFPVQFDDANRAYFTRMAKVVGGETGAAMTAIVADPADAKADAILSRDANYHAMLRTTCVATMLDAGHAQNALPQRARAVVNCRVFPGVPAEEVRQALVKAVDNPKVSITTPGRIFPEAAAPPMTAKVLGPIETITEQMWPGVPVVPILQPGATDATFLNAVGIPAFGVSGVFYDPDLGHIHGLNERIRVKSVMEGRVFLYRLVKAYAEQKD